MRGSSGGRVVRAVLVGAVVSAVCSACPPPVGPPTPATIVVTTTADVTNPSDGLVSLREAFRMASTDGVDSTIEVTGGADYLLTACSPGTLIHDGSGALTLSATGTGRATVQQTCPARVMSLGGSSLALEHLVVRGGRLGSPTNCTWPFMAPCNRGAGIEASAPITLTDVEMFDNQANLGSGGTIGGALVAGQGGDVIDSSFHDNVSDRWGGAIATFGDLRVTNSTFTANHALEGNALAVESGATVIEDSTFESNTGGSGGAIVMRGDHLTIRRSVLRANDSGGGPGAAVWIDEPAASFTLDRVAVVQNTGRAGALTSFGGVADYRISDSTVSDNVATMAIRDQYNASAGGLAISGPSAVMITGSTIAANSAPTGGGSNLDLTPGNGTTISLADSVVSDPLGGGTNCALRSNVLITTTSFLSDATCGSAASSGSAALGPLVASGSTWARFPSIGSSLLDVHAAPCATGADQRGATRPAGAGCDLGAIEQ